MSIAVRVTGYLARVAIFCSMAAVTGCHQEPVSRVYIEDYGWAAHGSPQVDLSQLPQGWVERNDTGDPGVGHGSTTDVTVNGGPIRIIVVPATNGPSTLPPTTGISATTTASTQPVEDWRHGSDICALHHRKMDTVLVHGLAGPAPFFVRGYFEAKEKLFPNCGIEYGPEQYSPKEGLIYVCRECEAARNAWKPDAR